MQSTKRHYCSQDQDLQPLYAKCVKSDGWNDDHRIPVCLRPPILEAIENNSNPIIQFVMTLVPLSWILFAIPCNRARRCTLALRFPKFKMRLIGLISSSNIFYFRFNQNWAWINTNGLQLFSNNETKVCVCKGNMWSKFQISDDVNRRADFWKRLSACCLGAYAKRLKINFERLNWTLTDIKQLPHW